MINFNFIITTNSQDSITPSAFLKTMIGDAQLQPPFGKCSKIPCFTIFFNFSLTKGSNWIGILQDPE